MKLKSLHIDGFGKFSDRDMEFADGLNIIYGKNEAGKSTLHTFMRCMLFGLERGRGRASKNDLYSKYDPWKGGAYGGSLRVEKNGSIYRLERSFRTSERSFEVINESIGRKVNLTRDFMEDLLCGLSETSYVNTISIGQLKSATEGGMVAELRNYIANMNSTASMSLNITKALDYLKEKRKAYERRLHADAAKDCAKLNAELDALLTQTSDAEYDNNIADIKKEREELRSSLEERSGEYAELKKYREEGLSVLSQARLEDKAAVEAYRKKTEADHAEYEAARKRAGSGRWGLLKALFILLTMVFLGLAGAGAYFSVGLWWTALPCALVLLACFFMVRAGEKRAKKEALAAEKLLREIYLRYVDDDIPFSADMPIETGREYFTRRMDELDRLCDAVEASGQRCGQKKEEIEELKSREKACDESLTGQQKKQWELEKKLERMDLIRQQLEQTDGQLKENSAIREEIAAIDLAIETMTELSESIRSSFGHYLNKNASRMINRITDGKYTSMSVDESLNVYMNTREKLVPVSQVSSGTMDQIYLALRLAAAALVQTGEDRMPLVFDDSFVLYDDGRLRAVLKWLAESFDCQILLFTCHQREARLLDEEGIAYHMLSMEE